MLRKLGWNWLVDDWNEAVHRSLVGRFTRGQVNTLRRQWWIGRIARSALLFLPVFLLVSILAPGADRPLLTALFFWSMAEMLLLSVHVGFGLRYGVSYAWAFHSARPLLLQRRAAYHDLKMKALIATAFCVAALVALARLAA